MASLVVDKNFWEGKKILLTGHTGFKGAWLSFWLKQLGADLLGFSQAGLLESRFYTDVTRGKIAEENGDIRSRESLLKVINEFQPDIVFHLAAQPLVLASYEDPLTTFDTNIMGTLNVLNAVCESTKKIALINVTSDKCYENDERQTSFTESDKLGGKDPYSNSKACADLVSSCYMHLVEAANKSDHIGIANVRAGNVLGGGDISCDRIVPDILSAADSQKVIEIRNPNAVRPWQHVLDPLRGYIILAQNLYNQPRYFSQSWNFGPSNNAHSSVGTLVEHLKARLDFSCHMSKGTSRALESNFLSIDSTKSKNELGWSTSIPFEEIVRLTVEWHLAANNGQNLEEMCKSQIEYSLK
ncbi:CDP-glucose 4,6-dehydratase [Candidatus Puniceispirillum marinum]|uniref:CDP-glucose 4,6-dehydratase n=1 Tax=Puniceispirillum marinum (strain IMCC1322) TaxID=488538 RepID=D5BSH7_PUNMI|nr:CDP-glucose 4,6-dehydratase [Candidatus Puniceispirillum marinum]ADE39224.1 CDP-glucose 4,6-dehydratase [Candidatus Puniceispirillum marinum IMCC1322]